MSHALTANGVLMHRWLVALRNDERRDYVVLGLAAIPAVVLSGIFISVVEQGSEMLRFDLRMTLGALMGWVTWGLLYVLITALAFRHATFEELGEVKPPRIGPYRRVFHRSRPRAGPGTAVTLAITAIAAATVLFAGDVLGDQAAIQTLVVISVAATVALSWMVLALSYAAHYAQMDARADGAHLAFPGTETPGFRSYLYFALSISTTFGTTDVVVRTEQMRRVISVHAVTAFVFNTFILALVIAGLTR